MVRCKFRLDHVSEDSQGTRDGKPHTTKTLKFSAVADNDPNSENHKFWEYTPSGQLEFCCAKTAAVAGMTVGEDYYIDIIEAHRVPPGPPNPPRGQAQVG